MSSRPQFSLRMLLLVAVMIAFTAATARPIPVPDLTGQPVREGGWWKAAGPAIDVQSLVRLWLCIAFPAMYSAGVVARGGYARAFCLAAALPAAMPLFLCVGAVAVAGSLMRDAQQTGMLGSIEWVSWRLGERITVFFVCAPIAGFSGMLYRGLTHSIDNHVWLGRWKITFRLVILVATAACLAVLVIHLPQSGVQKHMLGQLPVRLLACILVPALFAVAVAESAGHFCAFCTSAVLMTLAPLLLVCMIEFWDTASHGRWEPAQMYAWRYFVVTVWALAPCCGIVGVFFYWLLERGGSAVKKQE